VSFCHFGVLLRVIMVQVSSVRVRIRIVFKYELGFGCPYWSTGAGRMPVLQLKNE